MITANNIIVMNRGDTHEFDLVIHDSSAWETEEIYILRGDDAVYFGIMDPHQPFEEALVKKKFTAEDANEGNLVIVIDPKDTLDLIPGKYYYSVKLHMLHDDISATGSIKHVDKVQTIIDRAKFVICE